MSPARRVFVSPMSTSGAAPPSAALSRRRMIAGAVTAGAGTAFAAAAASAQDATPGTPPATTTIETESGQALYSLPRDHHWHGGPFYETLEYWEWHYWTAFVTDVERGEEWGLFYSTTRSAFNPATGEPGVLNYLSLTNLATQVFYPSARVAIAGGQFAGYPGDSSSRDDFAFGIDSGDGLVIQERYYARDERWGFLVRSSAVGDRPALAIDVELRLQEPGYLPATPTGVEEEGYSRDGLYNPETMYGLSYYYYAPSMTLSGAITAGAETHRVSGSAWLEHQWGNYATADPEASRWRWGSVRFADGSGINWRQWERGPDNEPVYHLNHFAIHAADGRVSYGYGRDLTYEVLDTWVSSRTGRRYGVYALLRTPVGTFYVSPIVSDQEIDIAGLTEPLWEGALEVRRDDSNGPLVGRMFMEEQFGSSGSLLPTSNPLARQLPLSGV